MNTLRKLALPLLLGLAVTWLANLYLSQAEKPKASIEMTTVVVASKMVPARTTLTSDMLSQKKVPGEFAVAQTVTRLEDVVGKITTVPLAEGEILLKSKVAGDDAKTALAYHIPEGRRAITIAVNEVIGVGGYPEVGDHVDVLATLPKNIAGEEKTLLLLEDVPILALSRNKSSTTAGKDAKTSSSTFTLAVTPEEGALLTFAEERGSLRLLLRPVKSDGRWGEMQVSSQLFTGSAAQPRIFELKSRLQLRIQLLEIEGKYLPSLGYKGGSGLSLAQVSGKTQQTINDLLRQGRARIVESADLLTWNRDPLHFRLTEKVPVYAKESQDLLTWQEYGLSLAVSAIAYNRPYLDLSIKPEIRYVDEREGTLAPYVGTRESEANIRIDRSEMVVLFGIVASDDLVLPQGVRTRHLLPERDLSPQVRSGERTLIVTIWPVVEQ
ncbi:MAG: Flp pilus assembly protein CpaB [Firmicutes bacterium]|nr:Flp pilus assembly protein CpaB [Bacillota bacterium]MCL5038830.1 Flp pilus assembly protein CpaB [Bacillota bacterium]